MLVRILQNAQKKYRDIDVGELGIVSFICKTYDNKNLFLYRENSYCYILEDGLDFEWVVEYDVYNKQ